MALTYQDHIDRALRAAAIVITEPPPSAGQLNALRRLHDDVLTTLAEATELICTSALGEPRSEQERAAIPAARELRDALQAHPRLAAPVGGDQPPSQRWSGRPADVTGEISALNAWKILAAETFLARSCLDQLRRRLTTPIRAAVLADLSATAEALATASQALRATAPQRDPIRGRVTDLAAAADRVQRDLAAAGESSSAVPSVSATRGIRAVHLVRGSGDVAPALANLARLTGAGPSRASELFAIAIVLDAIANSAIKVSESLDPEDQRGKNRDAEELALLKEYRHRLTAAIRQHQPRVASLGPGNPAAVAQARELRTAGVPHVEALLSRGDLAETATAEVQAAVSTLAAATSVIRHRFALLDQRGALLAYAWHRDSGMHWRRTTLQEVAPLLAQLDAAVQTAAQLRIDRGPARQIHAPAPVVDLAEAIDRRRAALSGANAGPRPAVPAPWPSPRTATQSPGGHAAGEDRRTIRR